MTLRDQFAMGAMQAIIVQNKNPYVANIVRDAYTLADAMVEHRTNHPSMKPTLPPIQ
jgi:hypothetical protein